MVGLDMNETELQHEIHQVKDLAFDLNAFHKWYSGVFRARAVPQLKVIGRNPLFWISSHCAGVME